MANREILLYNVVWESYMIGLGGGDGPTARGVDVNIAGNGNPGVLVYESNAIEPWQKVLEPGQVFVKIR